MYGNTFSYQTLRFSMARSGFKVAVNGAQVIVNHASAMHDCRDF
ncbi:hypothetical protein [Parabacteroides faecis]|uniref:Transposase n=1 Tax=Parabacteroides faecis TaxID=1217282 RepID=A0ABR6KQX6_9BACT|nr:hypothetical protein [Parabacteroides faecis]MBB4623794.1 hypothetical protein [Parabacteroides faecis]